MKVGKIEEFDKMEYSGTDTGIFGMLDTPSHLERLCIHIFKRTGIHKFEIYSTWYFVAKVGEGERV